MNELMERLEQANRVAEQARDAAERRTRRWQLAAGLWMGLGLLLLPLQRGTAQGQGVGNLPAQVTALQARVAPVESLLAHFSRDGNEVYITGANLHLRSCIIAAPSSTNYR